MDTIKSLDHARAIVRRLCSNHPSSLGLHPALYFYSPSGVFQPTALLSFVELMKSWDTPEFTEFTRNRAAFEEFLLSYRGITEAVRKLGSGSRSRPRVVRFYRTVLDKLSARTAIPALVEELRAGPDFSFFLDLSFVSVAEDSGADKFGREVKNGAFLKTALPAAPRCPTCGGILHHNGMQAGHIIARRAGGIADIANSQMQHPFCNSTYAN